VVIDLMQGDCFEPMWEQLKRVIKPNGAIFLTAAQPFMAALVMSNPKMFKYSVTSCGDFLTDWTENE